MKVVTLQQAVDLLVASGNAKQKAHAATGLDKATLFRIRAGRSVSSRTVAKVLVAAAALDPEITGIEHGARVEVDARQVRQAAETVSTLQAKVDALLAEIRRRDAREFRLRISRGLCLAPALSHDLH